MQFLLMLFGEGVLCRSLYCILCCLLYISKLERVEERERESKLNYLIPITPLREHLRTHETFIVDQIIRYFWHNYHKFSIRSYVVAIY